MKKLSLLIALCMLISIGGVYATWNYAQGEVVNKSKYFDDVTKITDKVIDTAKGTIHIDASTVKITIDDANNDFHGELNVEGEIRITFVPSDGADASVSTNGIPMTYQFSCTDGWNIFEVKTNAVQLSACKEYVITNAMLREIITLKSDVYLPTVEDYDDFKASLHDGSIGIVVFETK